MFAEAIGLVSSVTTGDDVRVSRANSLRLFFSYHPINLVFPSQNPSIQIWSTYSEFKSMTNANKATANTSERNQV